MLSFKTDEGSEFSLGIGRLKREEKKGFAAHKTKVGIVFQFPEHQLFDETVEKDICFGPMNFGVSEIDAAARKAIAQSPG